MIHLDIEVDLPQTVARALGATLADVQPREDAPVPLCPMGHHPFCLFVRTDTPATDATPASPQRRAGFRASRYACRPCRGFSSSVGSRIIRASTSNPARVSSSSMRSGDTQYTSSESS